MSLRSAKEIIAVARARGFDVRVKPGPPPMPVLRIPGEANPGNNTEALMTALKAWRLEIIEELSKETPCAE